MRSTHIVALLLAALLASCATLSPEEKAAVERGTPLLRGLLGTDLPELSGPAGVKVALADASLAQGNALRASVLLGEAAASLSEQPYRCSGQGALHYLQGLVAARASGTANEHGWQTLRDNCLNVEVEGREKGFQAFFHALMDKDNRAEMAGAPLTEQQTMILQRNAAWMGITRDEPADRCDTGWGERYRERLRQAAQGLVEAGRPDRMTGYFSLVALDVQGDVSRKALEALMTFAQEPNNAYLRRDAVSATLTVLAYGANYVPPVLTAELCQMLYEDLRDEVATDTYPGYDGRNAARLLVAFSSSGACLGTHDLTALVDQAYAAALADGSRRIGVLKLTGSMVASLAMQLFEGSGSAAATFVHLTDALRRVQLKLGRSDEDRALFATIEVVAAVPAVMGGNVEAMTGALASAAEIYDEALANPPAASPSEFREALPLLRLSARALLAGAVALTQEPGEALGVLETLRKHLQADLQAIFTTYELEDHSATIVAIIENSLAAFAKYQEDGHNPDAVLATLEKTLPAGPDESGWWGVGLDALRMVAWDAVAVQAHVDDPSSVLFAKALAQGERLAEQVVEKLLVQFELSGTLAHLLRMLPAAHRAVPALFDDKLDGDATALAVAQALQEPLQALTGNLQQSGKAADEAQVAALVAELLHTVASVGLAELIRAPEAALAKAVTMLESRLADYPPDIRVFLEMLAAVGRFYGDPDSAPAAFEQASAAAGQGLPRIAFVPLLLQASLVLADDGSTETLLKLVDKVLAYGLSATRCGQNHAVQSLFPARMWLRQAAGDHAGAKEDYESYARLVKAGFEGDIMVQCKLRSYADTLLFSIDLSNSTAAFLLPGKNEGTFNVGLGTETGRAGEGSYDELECEALYDAAPRFDRVLEAHLAFGVYALLSGEHGEAQKAFGAALAVGRQMVNGTQATLGRTRASGARQSASKVSLAMVAYASLLARLHGQTEVADKLVELGFNFALLQNVEWSSAVGADHTIPIFFQRIEALDGFDKLVTAWHAVGSRKELDAAVKSLAARAEQGGYPAWGVALAADALEPRLPPNEKQDLPAELKPGKRAGDVAKTLYAWRNMLVAAGTTGKLPPVADVDALARDLARAGFFWELSGPLMRMGIHAWRQQDVATAFKLLDLPLGLLPPEVAMLPYLDTALLAADMLVELNQRDKAIEAMVIAANQFDGYHTEQEEIQMLYRLLQLAGPTGDGELTWRLVTKLAPMVRASSGAGNLAYFTLVALDVAFGYLVDQPIPDAAIARFAAHGKMVRDAGETQRYFQLLAQTDDPAVRKDLSNQYLIYVLQSGPAPKLPERPKQAE